MGSGFGGELGFGRSLLTCHIPEPLCGWSGALLHLHEGRQGPLSWCTRPSVRQSISKGINNGKCSEENSKRQGNIMEACLLGTFIVVREDLSEGVTQVSA